MPHCILIIVGYATIATHQPLPMKRYFMRQHAIDCSPQGIYKLSQKDRHHGSHYAELKKIKLNLNC